LAYAEINELQRFARDDRHCEERSDEAIRNIEGIGAIFNLWDVYKSGIIYRESRIMTDTVLDVQTLSKVIFSKFSAERVDFHEENGSIILTPIVENRRCFDVLFGMFSDGRISSYEYMKEKQFEKELEN